MLAGRKLLLADDSATIQKVIDLTFADEGVRVVAVGNGQDAIDQLLELQPDIVLADVFMPARNGYEVCEYIKTNEKLKHIPVMLLVGSFEPFDEAEARRVGADDILTKPFQSIRRLIDRVGALVSGPPVEKESPTAELPKVEQHEQEEDVLMDTHELEVTTADTLPLEDAIRQYEHKVEQPVAATESSPREEKMETEPHNDSQSDADVLLDLGDFEPVNATAEDEFVLELDDEVAPAVAAAPAPASEPAPVRPYVEPEVREAVAAAAAYESTYQPQVHSSLADTQEVPYAAEIAQVEVVEPEPVTTYAEPEPVEPRASVSADQLSPEMIDAIARRVVEMMSDKVVREIAWEVVPDLAELLIKQQLEEKAK